MHLRIVNVTIAPGRTEDYWAWAGEIIALWDRHGIRRAGGPYRAKSPAGADVGIWLTVHDSAERAQHEFGAMYATPEGKALIDRRPPLVAETTFSTGDDWDPSQGAPPMLPPDLTRLGP
jgi:hypothetical protein